MIFSSVSQSAFTQNDSGSLLERAISAAREAADRVSDENRKKEKSNYTPRYVQSNNNYGQNNRYNDTKTYQNNRPNVNQYGYVDLGLPSGTLWKASNENGFYSSADAVDRFGTNLPSEFQWKELKNNCKWTWTGNGYRVTGPNGNYIHLPLSGYRTPNGQVHDVGREGSYWTGSIYYGQTFFNINKAEVGFYGGLGKTDRSVRLISNY